MRGTRILALGALAALTIVHGHHGTDPLEAGTALRMELEDAVEPAALVFEGRVLEARPVAGANGDVFTDYDLRVDRTFLGEPAGAHTIRLPGGMLPSGRGTLVPGMPSLSIGQDVVLLLTEASEHGGARMTVGLTQGRYRIVRDPGGARFAVRDDAVAALVDATGQPASSGAHAVQEYAEFRARLEAAANATRARRAGETGEER
mgnify:CR=1 FL=1